MMVNYLIGLLFLAGILGLALLYWYRRIEREHQQRMAEIDARAAAHEAAFEARNRVWAEEDARAKAELDARIAAINAEMSAEADADPKIASPGGA